MSKQRFSDLMDELGTIYEREVSVTLKKLYWEDLPKGAFAQIEAAFHAHRRDPDRGRFFPKPADLIAKMQILRTDQRPDADEAWALALDTFDEAATVCVTDEILEAVGAAKSVWNIGDTVGARMAFKAAYGRLVSAGRASGQTPTWQLSLGWDAQRRTLAAQEAVRSGRLTAQQVRAHLPAPPAAGIPALIAGLMTNPSNVVALPLDADVVTRQRLRALREAIAGRSVPADTTATPGALEAAAERARFAQRQRQALDAVEALAAQKATPESA
jgi:hypothetical protein